MAAVVRRGVQIGLGSLALGLLLIGFSWAEEPRDLLERARQRQVVAAQKTEREIREAREAAYALRTQPDKAMEQIKEAQALLNKDTVLSEERRASLQRTLRLDLGYFQGLALQGTGRPSVPGGARVYQREGELPPRVAHQEARRLQDTRYLDAQQQMHRDIRAQMNAHARVVADGRATQHQARERYLGVQRDIVESTKLPLGDYELPANWQELSKRRSPEAKLSAEEKALLKALSKTIRVDFKETPLQTVLEQLRKETGQNIVLDPKAMTEAGVMYDAPITLRMNSSARTVLKRIFADLGLTFIIKDQTIEVTSLARAKEMVVTRAYYVGDLVTYLNPYLVGMGTGIQGFYTAQNIAGIANAITSQIDPQSWQVNNPEAAGTITFHPITMTFLIRQTSDFHYMMGNGHAP